MVNYEWPDLTDNCGGGGRIGKQLLRGLSDRGHNVRLVTDSADGSPLTFPLRRRRRIHRTVGWFDPDVIHAQFSIPSGLAAARAAVKHDIPLVTSVMGADVYDPTRYEIIRPALDQANRYVFNRSEKLVTPSVDMAKRIPKYAQTKNTVIPYGIDPSNWKWRDKDVHDPLRVLTVCRLVDRKNLFEAIDTVEKVSRRGVNVEHRVVGKGPLADDIEAGAKQNDWLYYRGYVDDLQDEFDWGDVFFLPSKHEAFGIVFLEALACGLPVVTSDTGGQSELITPTLGRAKSDTEGWATALENIATHYEIFQPNTKDYVKRHFSRGTMVDEYESLFNRVHE